ncbi:MAG TPA: hypothetical protein VFZ65_10395 [Planctomycetota bacterium]|nr:hypothetical protein [Planctomycetota bacterium]
MRTPCCLVPLLLATGLVGQSMTWNVPHRGAHVYTRTTQRFEVTAAMRLRPEWVLQTEPDKAHEWRYFAGPARAMPQGFEQPGYDDSAWLLGRGEFGPESGKLETQQTRWASEALWLRTTVDLGTKKPKALWFVADHDDGLRIWLNGVLVVADDGFGRNRNYVVAGKAVDAWQRGTNTLAVQCINTGGAQYLNLAMANIGSVPADLRTAEDLQRALREDREQADRVQRELFGAFRVPPLLLQGDLDAAGQRVRIPPGDLRDLGWWLAVDLGIPARGGSVQLDATRLFRLGDLQLKGRATAIDADGWQTIDVSVKNTPEPGLGEDSKRWVERFVRPHVLYGFDGALSVRRHVVTVEGRTRVDGFATDLQGRVLRGKGWKEQAATLQQQEVWVYASTRDNQDAEFRAMVAESLRKGTEALRAQLANLSADNLKPDAENADRSYHTGRLALGLLALVAGGLPRDDEVVQRCLTELRQRTLIDTYTLGNALMALEAYYAPPNEIGDLKMGTIDQPRPRHVEPADQALMQKWTDHLLTNVDDRVDQKTLLRFHYVGGADFDNSVNQYALLGLYSAQLCGVRIDPNVWEAACNHLLLSQGSEGAKVELDLVDYRAHARRQADPNATMTAARCFARANGWGYKEPKSDGEQSPVWGSMTCAGITGLAICQAALISAGQKRTKLQSEATRARNDGFAWLARFMTQRCHPGAIERQAHWFYYYLCSLERAALLSGIALIQDRDWYFEGAMVLVLAQQADGHWPAELLWDEGIERDAMAILFLKQSTLPVLTGR